MASDLAAELLPIDRELQQIQQQIEDLLRRQALLQTKKRHLQKCLKQANDENKKIVWHSEDFPWSAKLNELKSSIFKINDFRPLQLSAINITLSKKDCILIMPTGGGKSLCFQLPALVSEGVTLVISPLISLMEDQLMALNDLNISASMLSSNRSREQNNKTQATMIDKNSDLKLLYITPERLANSKVFMNKLEKMNELGRLSRIVIDEIHCCSQWGHDFRPDYKMLGIMKRQFPKVPILGLTATATAHVIEDVKNILHLPVCTVLKRTFNRPNLFYEVRLKPTSQKDQIEDLSNVIFSRFSGQSGIIYCFSTKDTEEVARELRKRNIRAHHYHAYVEAQLRSSVHRKWVANEIQIVVATIAFGMGINKANVRFVIHHSLSKSVENYYQESGRAGRDGKPAYCLLYYQCGDIFRQSTMVFTEQMGLENLYKMVAYCNDLTRCRRQLIADHFGELWTSEQCNEMCDHCKKKGNVESKDIRKYCLQLLKIMESSSRKDVRLTANKLIDAWKKDPKGSPFQKESCEKIIIHLLLESYLKEDFHFTPYSTISYIVPGPKASFAENSDCQIFMPALAKPSSHSNENSNTSSSLVKSQNCNIETPSVNSNVKNKNHKQSFKKGNDKVSQSKKSIKKKKIKHVIDDDSNVEEIKEESISLIKSENTKLVSISRDSKSPLLVISDKGCSETALVTDASRVEDHQTEMNECIYLKETNSKVKINKLIKPEKNMKRPESFDFEETPTKKSKLCIIDITDNE